MPNRLWIFRPDWPAFRVCGLTGFCLATALAAGLTHWLRLSLPVLGSLAVLAVCVFFGLAMAEKVIAGHERLVYYHHEIAVLSAAALALQASQIAVLPYLDVVALSLGLFLTFGRIGCLLAGCCHGRPHRWGIRYGSAHRVAGFPRHLVGVPVLPVQAIESACVLVVVALGLLLILTRAPGAALAWYLGAYGIVRFLLELLRGDTARPYWLGLSEAQWMSLGSIALVVHAWLRVPGLLLGGTSCAFLCILYVRVRFRKRLGSPMHIREMARAADRLSEVRPDGIQVAQTSLGIRISAGRLPGSYAGCEHLAISRSAGGLSTGTGHRLARLLARERNLSVVAVFNRNGQVFHLVGRVRHPGASRPRAVR
jgi:hypothetical protein